MDWSNLLQRAKEQTITGVILPIFERLPSHLRPLRGDILRVHQMTLLNKQYRTHQIEVLRELLKLVNRAGVARPVLLKGLGVGLNYLDPTLRQCGDIDLYVGEREYERVWDFVVKELAIPREESHSSHHFEFQFMDTTIEIHRYAIARGLLRKGGVLLLDEPTSALDSVTEELLMDRLRLYAQNRTMIMVTHREVDSDKCRSVVRLTRGC